MTGNALDILQMSCFCESFVVWNGYVRKEKRSNFYNIYLFYHPIFYFMFPRRRVSSEQIFQRTAVVDCVWKLHLNSSFCVITADLKSRWPHERKAFSRCRRNGDEKPWMSYAHARFVGLARKTSKALGTRQDEKTAGVTSRQQYHETNTLHQESQCHPHLSCVGDSQRDGSILVHQWDKTCLGTYKSTHW